MSTDQPSSAQLARDFHQALLALEPKPEAMLVSLRLLKELQTQAKLKEVGTYAVTPDVSNPRWRVHLEFAGTAVDCDPANLGHVGQPHWSVFRGAA